VTNFWKKSNGIAAEHVRARGYLVSVKSAERTTWRATYLPRARDRVVRPGGLQMELNPPPAAGIAVTARGPRVFTSACYGKRYPCEGSQRACAGHLNDIGIDAMQRQLIWTCLS